MKILYLDESGCDNIKKIDPTYPIFVLGGVIVDSKNCSYNKNKMDNFKLSFWNDNRVILHCSEILHQTGNFEFLQNEKKQSIFLKKLNTLMDDLKYQVIVCIIDLPRYIETHKHSTFNLYYYALTVIIEKFIYELKNQSEGKIFIESRNKIKDKQILNVFASLKEHGTKYVKGVEISSKIKTFQVIKKVANFTGLQVADLVLSPIARKYLGKKLYINLDTIKSKCLNKNGKITNFGITIIK